MRGRLLLGLFVLGLASVTAAVAGINGNWSVHANGSQEVPPRDSQGQAQAILHLAPDGQSMKGDGTLEGLGDVTWTAKRDKS